MYRSVAALLPALAIFVGANPAYSADERWRCVVTAKAAEGDVTISYDYTISDTEVTSRAISRIPTAPTEHYEIIENGEVGLMAVTNRSWRSYDGLNRIAEIIALDKRSGDFVQADVSLIEKPTASRISTDAWNLRGKCHRT